MHVSPCLRHFYADKLKEATPAALRAFLDEAEKGLAEVEEDRRQLAERADLSAGEIAAARRYLDEDEWHFRARLAAIRELLEGDTT